MSNLVGFSVALRNSRADIINSSANAGKLQLYTGTRPVSADSAITTQVKLVEFVLASPAGTVTNGVLTGDTVESVLAAASGNAGWARMVNSAGAAIADFDCGVTGSGSAVEINNLAVAEGGEVLLSGWTITEG